MLRAIDKALISIPFWEKIRKLKSLRNISGFEETIWTRKVADEQARELISILVPSELDALEISGDVWRSFGFKTYKQMNYPEFNICTDVLPEQFDIVIAEHIFEHLLWPYRAARNVHQM